jgi:predicted MFS family arabinose efflux permease
MSIVIRSRLRPASRHLAGQSDPMPPSTESNAPPAERQTSWLGVSVGLGLGALASYHQFKLPPVLPILLEQYGYGKFAAGSFMSIYAAIGIAASAFLGARLQRHGMPPFLLAAGLLVILGSVLTLAVPALVPAMLAARGLEGVGYAVLAVASPVLMTASASRRHKTMAIALFATWIPAGQLIAMAVAQPFIADGAWRPVWWVGIGLTVFVVLLGWRAARHHAPHRAAAAGGGPAPFGALSRHERWGLILVAATFMLWSTEMFAMFTWLPQFLVEARGLDPSDTIFIYAVPPVMIVIFNLVGGLLLRAGVALAPLLAFSLAMQAAFWLALPHLEGAALGLGGLILFGAGAGIAPTCLFAAPALILGAENAGGGAFGIVMTGRSSGVLLGPILLPPVLLAMGAWADVGPVFGAITLASAALALVLGVLLKRRAGAP